MRHARKSNGGIPFDVILLEAQVPYYFNTETPPQGPLQTVYISPSTTSNFHNMTSIEWGKLNYSLPQSMIDSISVVDSYREKLLASKALPQNTYIYIREEPHGSQKKILMSFLNEFNEEQGSSWSIMVASNMPITRAIENFVTEVIKQKPTAIMKPIWTVTHQPLKVYDGWPLDPIRDENHYVEVSSQLDIVNKRNEDNLIPTALTFRKKAPLLLIEWEEKKRNVIRA